MIRINLLPFRAARKKENLRKQVSVYLLSLILLTLGLFYFNFTLGNKISRLETNIEEAKKQIAAYEKTTQEIEKIKQQLDIFRKKIDVIKNLDQNRKKPVILLDAMTRMVIPKRLWFTSFESVGDQVNITGIALDNKTVAEFMTNLEGSKLFKSVNLVSIKAGAGETSKLKTFQVSCVN
jgi:type IV pilus assembly protein PilN